jgi:hypothetical protein
MYVLIRPRVPLMSDYLIVCCAAVEPQCCTHVHRARASRPHAHRCTPTEYTVIIQVLPLSIITWESVARRVPKASRSCLSSQVSKVPPASPAESRGATRPREGPPSQERVCVHAHEIQRGIRPRHTPIQNMISMSKEVF